MSMDGVLRLYFGESNLPTPDYIKQAAVRAMAGRLHVLHRERRAAFAAARHRRKLPPAACGGARPRQRNRRHRFRRAGPQRGHPLRARSRRRSPGAHARLAQRLVHRRRWRTPPSGRFRIRCAATATAWISTRWKPPSPRARACCSTPRHPIRWAGWPPTRNSRACSISRAATGSGCWPTRSTTGCTTPAAAWASPCPPSCARPRATTP